MTDVILVIVALSSWAGYHRSSTGPSVMPVGVLLAFVATGLVLIALVLSLLVHAAGRRQADPGGWTAGGPIRSGG